MIAFNHRATAHRGTEVNTTGDPTMGWAALTAPAGLNARPEQNALTSAMIPSPTGEMSGFTLIWFLDNGFTNIGEGDVLDITDGPIAPSRWRIHSVSKPTGRNQTVHHVEVATKVYTGAIS